MITINDLFGKKQVIEHVKFGDVTGHFDQIKENIPENEWVEFNLRMCACIDTKTAFTLSDHSCFLYYKITAPGFADGVALQGQGHPTKLMALISGIFGKIDKTILRINFTRHPGKTIEEYKNFLSPVNVSRHHTLGRPLSIRIDKIREKIDKLYDRRGITP